MFNVRKDRLSEQLLREVASIIHQELKDPRLGFVTLTRVDLSNDFSHAKVWFSCLGTEAQQRDSQAALDDSAKYVRSLIKKRLRLKIIPEFVFLYDHGLERSLEVEAELDRLRRAEDPPQP
jgi:ribosome-binding factor A